MRKRGRTGMIDVTALGEVLIDFTPGGKNEQGIAVLAQNPGGAPANVLAMNARLGGKTAFIGKVGQDAFGEFLRQTLTANHIDVSGLVTDEEVPTTLAFVHLDCNGDRSFTFYRNPGADMMLTSKEIRLELIEECKIFHFGSVSLTDDPACTATFVAANYAKQCGKIVSFDPNFRPFLWNNIDRARKQIEMGIQISNLLKVSEEEMTLITGENDVSTGSAKLLMMGPALVLITLGDKGTFYRNNICSGHLNAYNVKAVDTTGAGDAFMGAIHYQIKDKTNEDLRIIPEPELQRIVNFANAAGGFTTTKGGAIPAMPTMTEIKTCMETVPLKTN